MRKIIVFGAATLATAALLGATANAAPLNTTFTAAVYSATTPTNDGTYNTQQALPTNPLITGCSGSGTNACSSEVSDTSFTYTGQMNFNDPAGGTDTIGGFLATGTGTTTGLNGSVSGTTLSSANFTHVSLFSFTFTTGSSGLSNITITHDDGISLYAGSPGALGSQIVNASAPTSATPTSVPNLAANTTYTLYYAEANGLPAVLNFDATVPEPASLALVGAGLAGIGVLRRRRNART